MKRATPQPLQDARNEFMALLIVGTRHVAREARLHAAIADQQLCLVGGRVDGPRTVDASQNGLLRWLQQQGTLPAFDEAAGAQSGGGGAAEASEDVMSDSSPPPTP